MADEKKPSPEERRYPDKKKPTEKPAETKTEVRSSRRRSTPPRGRSRLEGEAA